MIKDNLCEIAEVKEHPRMVGVQYHPEFTNRTASDVQRVR
ncbi:MAG: hypothetical protein HN411_05905 [Waddliaceae bacterium]|nr:hypothetical protein [Waddliaceae bacterium]MBT3579053.1 hypothetical protein [Waddliaceae bacterium]MBT4444486.1 hypothetical protein [Waddliaceae bacterium]MBT6929075.1 hypothetical protein [Waddliaceae bacterium]MBT7264735.1 hypothetical protein [Waddliaceae bacterium]